MIEGGWGVIEGGWGVIEGGWGVIEGGWGVIEGGWGATRSRLFCRFDGANSPLFFSPRGRPAFPTTGNPLHLFPAPTMVHDFRRPALQHLLQVPTPHQFPWTLSHVTNPSKPTQTWPSTILESHPQIFTPLHDPLRRSPLAQLPCPRTGGTSLWGHRVTNTRTALARHVQQLGPNVDIPRPLVLRVGVCLPWGPPRTSPRLASLQCSAWYKSHQSYTPPPPARFSVWTRHRETGTVRGLRWHTLPRERTGE